MRLTSAGWSQAEFLLLWVCVCVCVLFWNFADHRTWQSSPTRRGWTQCFAVSQAEPQWQQTVWWLFKAETSLLRFLWQVTKWPIYRLKSQTSQNPLPIFPWEVTCCQQHPTVCKQRYIFPCWGTRGPVWLRTCWQVPHGPSPPPLPPTRPFSCTTKYHNMSHLTRATFPAGLKGWLRLYFQLNKR